MANEFRTLNSHSAEYFGDTRDYWWNLDFLELIGKRLSLDRVQDVLDVGSGVGHWGQLLAKILPSRVRVQGVDRDPLWIEKATARAAALGLADRFSYQVAVAEKLPFPDASFDLVTCQTVLIHMPDPGATVDEMVRVARPGALILAAEPNNAARALLFDSVSFHDPVDDILTRARLQLTRQGRAGRRQQFNRGPRSEPLRRTEPCRCLRLSQRQGGHPPAALRQPRQRTALEECADFNHRGFWSGWSREITRRYFLAGGGCEAEFEALWLVAIGGNDKFDKAIADRTYAGRAGAGIGYLIAGRKPRLDRSRL